MVKRGVPLLIVIGLMASVYFLGVDKYLSFETLKTHRQATIHFVAEHWLLCPVLFVALYLAVAALSLPVGMFLSITGGFLFPQPLSTIYVVIGATTGASILFLIAKTSVGEVLRRRAGKNIEKMQRACREHGASYLLFLRFVPLFPFWLVNIAPAFFGIRLWTFAWTTFLGVIPGAFVFTQAGTGLGAILDAGGEPSLQTIFNWQMRVALVALGLFALIPIGIQKLRRMR